MLLLFAFFSKYFGVRAPIWLKLNQFWIVEDKEQFDAQ